MCNTWRIAEEGADNIENCRSMKTLKNSFWTRKPNSTKSLDESSTSALLDNLKLEAASLFEFHVGYGAINLVTSASKVLGRKLSAVVFYH